MKKIRRRIIRFYRRHQKIIRRLALILIIFLLALLFSFCLNNNPLHLSTEGSDRWTYRMVAKVIQNGGAPYIDAFDNKGALLYLIHLLGLTLNADFGFWFIEIIFLFVTFWFMYKIARLAKVGRLTALLCLLFGVSLLFKCFFGGELTEDCALPFIASSLYFFLDFLLNRRVTNLRLILCGLGLGATFLLRANLVAVWAVFIPIVLIYCVAHHQWRDLRRFLFYVFCGFALIVGPVFLWLAAKGALAAFFEYSIFYNFIYNGLDVEGIHTYSYSLPETLWYFISFTPVLIALIANFLNCFFKKRRAISILYFCFLSIALLFVAISTRQYSHYGMALVPLVVFPLACFLRSIADFEQRYQKRIGFGFGFGFIIVFGAGAIIKNLFPDNFFNISYLDILLFASLLLIFMLIFFVKQFIKIPFSIFAPLFSLALLSWLILPDWITQIATISSYFGTELAYEPWIYQACDYIDASAAPDQAISSPMILFNSVYFVCDREPAAGFVFMNSDIFYAAPELAELYYARMAEELPPIIVAREYDGELEDDIELAKFLTEHHYEEGLRIEDPMFYNSVVIIFRLAE